METKSLTPLLCSFILKTINKSSGKELLKTVIATSADSKLPPGAGEKAH